MDATETARSEAALSYLPRGYVTTDPASASVTRCAVDPVGDVAALEANPSYVEAYRSGRVGAVWAPTRPGFGLVHRQGIGRSVIGGRNYLVVSESVDLGTYSSHVVDGGGFEVVELGSRGGTRGPLGGNVTPTSVPPRADHLVSYTSAHFRGWDHAGGIQISGRYLAIPFEDSNSWYDAGFRIFDLSAPAAPRWPVETSLRTRGDTKRAGAAALTQLASSRGGPGSYIAMVFGRDSRDVEIFVSSLPAMPGHGGSTSRWISRAWAWMPFDFEDYQGLQLLTACDGTLYLLGTHNNGLFPGAGEDWADLWRVGLSATYQPALTKVAKRHLYCRGQSTNGERYCNFQAGAGIYVEDDGHLCLYSVEHYNDGYPWTGAAVKAREFCR